LHQATGVRKPHSYPAGSWQRQPLHLVDPGSARGSLPGPKVLQGDCWGKAHSPMPDELLSAKEAARRLAMAVTTLYDWLGQSDRGLLLLRGQPVTIQYLQGGPAGQGRIRIQASEVERLKDLLRVRPHPIRPRRPPSRPDSFPGITVVLGRPDR
jgi:hypothetical protein